MKIENIILTRLDNEWYWVVENSLLFLLRNDIQNLLECNICAIYPLILFDNFVPVLSRLLWQLFICENFLDISHKVQF